jgi:hypothetical protein
MAPTFSAPLVNSRRDQGQTVVDMTCDAAYPGSGGYPITAANLGMMDMPDDMNCAVKTGHGFLPVYNQGASKLQMLKGAAGVLVEAASADITSSVVVRLTSTGRPIL